MPPLQFSAKSLNVSLDKIVMGMIYARFLVGLLGSSCTEGFILITNWDVSKIKKHSCRSVCVCIISHSYNVVLSSRKCMLCCPI